MVSEFYFIQSHVAPLSHFLLSPDKQQDPPYCFTSRTAMLLSLGFCACQFLSQNVLSPVPLSSLDYLLLVCIGCYFLTENYPDTLQYHPCSCFLRFPPYSSPSLVLVAFIAVFPYSTGQQAMACRSNLVCHLLVNKVLMGHSNAHSFVHCLCTVYDHFLCTKGRVEQL